MYHRIEHGRDLQPLIGPGDVPLEMNNTRNTFFTQVGQREHYSSVMAADLIGDNARAKGVDARMASDSLALQRFRIGTRLSTSVMLYSFGAREGEDRGVSEAELIASVVAPGLDRMSLTTALNDLRQEMLYLHYTGRRYRFETQPNLNKLIEDEKAKYSLEDIQRKVETVLKETIGNTLGAVVWPSGSERINDGIAQLQVVFLGFSFAYMPDE